MLEAVSSPFPQPFRPNMPIRMKRHVGLTIWTDGKEDRNGMSWAQFHARVATAAAKPKGRGNGPVANLRPSIVANLWGQPIPDHRRCDFKWSKGERKGDRCKAWAMKGAARCARHGGYRQNPEHPATIRRMPDIEQRMFIAASVKQLRNMNHKHRTDTESALRGEALPLSPQNIVNGYEALTQDDNGTAWRRFIKHAKLSAPKQQQNARKLKLRSRKGSAT